MPLRPLPDTAAPCAPGIVNIPEGLMDKIQVQIINSQLLQRVLKGFKGAVIAGVLYPELRRQEQFTSGNAGVSNGIATAFSL